MAGGRYVRPECGNRHGNGKPAYTTSTAKSLVKSGKVSMKTIDDAVRNVLSVKFRLGLFDNPFVDENLEKITIKKPEFLQAARESAIKVFRAS
jgi:beta-glucosidase-like glycosyl hydrolase